MDISGFASFENKGPGLIEETSSQILNTCTESILLSDISGKILYANKIALQSRFAEVPDLIGKPIWDVLSKQQRSRLKLIINQVCTSKQPQSIKFKDGGRWYLTKISVFSDEDGQNDSLGFFTTDVTNQTHAEEQLKKTLLELATAQEDERHRISRDLHDEIGQRMTALLLQLRALKEIVKKDQKVDLEEINSASRNLEIIIKHLRQIFFQLYPPSLSKVSLPKVLEALCTSVEEANGIKIDLSCQEEIPELLENQESTIYRFVQEGLNNVVKHARATSVWVNLDYSDGDINISIEDDGVGFKAEEITEGVGFRGIRERFVILNGCFEVDSAPEKGTRLSGSIPVRRKIKRVLK